jgi:hypothetical protein
VCAKTVPGRSFVRRGPAETIGERRGLIEGTIAVTEAKASGATTSVKADEVEQAVVAVTTTVMTIRKEIGEKVAATRVDVLHVRLRGRNRGAARPTTVKRNG